MAVRYRYPVTYAGIELHVLTLAHEQTRDLVEWRYARGDGAALSDRGRAPRRDTWTIVIVGDADEQEERRARLLALSLSGEARMLSHPMDGQWYARIVSFSSTVDAATDTWEAVFLEDLPVTESRADELRGEQSSREAVAASAEAVGALALELEDSAMEAAATQAVDLADAWLMSVDEGEPPWAPDQRAELDAWRTRCDATVEDLGRSSEPGAYTALVAMHAMWSEVERFARTTRTTAPRSFPVTFDSSGPLMPVLVSVYGIEARTRQREVVRLNGLRNPLAVPAGAVVLFPVT
jgi:prophage DNA circulation protein